MEGEVGLDRSILLFSHRPGQSQPDVSEVLRGTSPYIREFSVIHGFIGYCRKKELWEKKKKKYVKLV